MNTTINDKNKAIDEFNDNCLAKRGYSDFLHYYLDYNSLMAVVKKIGSMNHRFMFKTDEGQHHCEIWCYSDQGEVVHEIECEEDESGTMISAIHEACYQFAVWHKQNP